MTARAGRRGLVIILPSPRSPCACWLWPPGLTGVADKPQVAVPPPTASPRQSCRHTCVRWTLHDSATGRSTVDPWLSRHHRFVAEHHSEHHPYLGLAPFSTSRSHPPASAYEVPVEFWYSSHWWKQDPSFPDGQEGWGYQLVRSHGRYRSTTTGSAEMGVRI